MLTQKLFESLFSGLPKHWIKYLALRWGKGYTSSRPDMAGDNSTVVQLKVFDPGKIKKALNDINNVAIIGRVSGEPVFMIARNYYKPTKYSIFEVTPGNGQFGAKGSTNYTRRGRKSTNDAYSLNEMVYTLDQLFQDQGKSFSGLTLDIISIDQERFEKANKRRQYKNSGKDPLKPEIGAYSTHPSIAQKERSKKYAEIKRPELDKKIEKEVENIKNQMSIALDKALESLIKNVKEGNTYSVNRTNIAANIANAINTQGIERLAKAYSAINVKYSDKSPTEISRDLKRSGVL